MTLPNGKPLDDVEPQDVAREFADVFQGFANIIRDGGPTEQTREEIREQLERSARAMRLWASHGRWPRQRKERVTDADEHRERHGVLHRHFDELLADFLRHNQGALPSNTTLRQLMDWSYRQTITPQE